MVSLLPSCTPVATARQHITHGVHADVALLRTNDRGECALLGEGNKCRVWTVRPTACATYPFWNAHLVSAVDWRAAASTCEGISLQASCRRAPSPADSSPPTATNASASPHTQATASGVRHSAAQQEPLGAQDPRALSESRIPERSGNQRSSSAQRCSEGAADFVARVEAAQAAAGPAAALNMNFFHEEAAGVEPRRGHVVREQVCS